MELQKNMETAIGTEADVRFLGTIRWQTRRTMTWKVALDRVCRV